jgi:hypothetical protein
VARLRPTASDVQQTLTGPLADADRDHAGPGAPTGALSPAQAHALRRCAPLNSAEFKARRQLVQRGNLTLRGILLRGTDDADASPTPPAKRSCASRWRTTS